VEVHRCTEARVLIDMDRATWRFILSYHFSGTPIEIDQVDKHGAHWRQRWDAVCGFIVTAIAIANQRRQLSGDALAALKEFYGERDAREKQFENLKSQAEDDFEGKLSMDAFIEDWNASQFWYNDETATTLARQLLDGATDDTNIAVVSAPSAFIQLKNLMVSSLETWARLWLIRIRPQGSTSADHKSNFSK
jgi:hypothetical protein